MDSLSATLQKETAGFTAKVEKAHLPEELKEKTSALISRLSRFSRFGDYSAEYEKTVNYIDWLINLPWNNRSQDTLDLKEAKKILDKNHYGLEEVKERILEYLSVLKLKGSATRAPVLCFIGLVGTGKTTLAYSIAESLGRKFSRIPLGGMGDSLDLRGQSRLRPDAEPGLIIKALRKAGTKNPVILLDELDRVVEESRNSIMGVLLELLDPEQNGSFRDHFIDFPFDLSEVLFIATANNTTNISVAVMDRLEPIQMPSYSDEEKITIGRNYIFPAALKEAGLAGEAVRVDEEVWPKIVRPLGYDAGVRALERTISGLCRKIAKMMVDGKGRSFHITLGNIKDFLPTW